MVNVKLIRKNNFQLNISQNIAKMIFRNVYKNQTIING